MFGLEYSEILIIALIIALLFGGNKILGFAKSLGRFKGEFKKGQMEIDKELGEIENSTENTKKVK
ncbi:MAG: twin-arginine translocase TatA/TatE family subunit [bacterium]|nr:twin-arginine translocase TatA/TatE family subunit [bacterium]